VSPRNRNGNNNDNENGKGKNGSSPIKRAMADWLRTPFQFEPDLSPSDLIVSLLQGGKRERNEADTILDLLVEVLPQLRGGLNATSAEFTARVLIDYLHLSAAAVVSRQRILAFVGRGSDHHLTGSRSMTALTRRVLRTGEVVRTHDRAIIGCWRPECPLDSALVAPLVVRGNVVGALKLYYGSSHTITDADERVARGIARVFGVYLELGELDARASLVTRAELNALRAQISPHFLFNTLTTIAALTRVDGNQAHDLILDFAEFFRETLSKREELVTLGDELQYVERYVRFESLRLGDRLTVEYDIDENALGVLVPVLALQPLVENAIIHGIAPKGGPGTLRISARPERGGFEVSVSDDGVGIREPNQTHGHSGEDRASMGVAANNIHHRLTGIFGVGSGLRIRRREGAGTTAGFWVPAETPRGAKTP
jgi:two-component system LytT family sensor kinase